MPAASQTSRGDLLRWMHRFSKDEEELQRLTAPILAYELPPLKVEEKIQRPDVVGLVTDKNKEKPEPKPILAERPPELFYALTQRERYATPETQNNPLAGLQGLEPLQDEDLQAFADAEPLPWQPILPLPRLANFLREHLAYSAGQQLDVAKLVKQVANLKILAKLPRKPRIVPAGRVIVLVDLNKRLRPFWQDAHNLCQLISRQHGRNGLDIRVIDDNPQDGYWDWFDDKQRPQPWQRLQGNSVVFIISDLGQLAAQDNLLQRQWLAFIRQLHHQNIQPVVLAPLSVAQQTEDLHKASRQILWNKHSRLVPEKLNIDLKNHQQAVKRVLGLLSVAAHVEPELLRAILGCLPAHEADSGIEAAAWLHEDVQWGYTAIRLQPDKRVEYQNKFKEEPVELQLQILALLQRHHARQFKGVWAEEVLNAAPLLQFSATELEGDLEKAEQFMQGFTRSFMASSASEGMAQYARRHLQRLGKQSTHHYNRNYTSALYCLAYQQQLRAGAEIPAELDAALVQAVIGQQTTPIKYVLKQLGEYLVVSQPHQDTQGLQLGSVLAEFTSVSDALILNTVGNSNSQLLPLLSNLSVSGEDLGKEKTITLSPLNGQTLTIDTGLEKLVVAPVNKPSWAYKISHYSGGLFATLNFANMDFDFVLHMVEEILSTNVNRSKWQPCNNYGYGYGSGAGYGFTYGYFDRHSFIMDNLNHAKSNPILTENSIGFDDYGLYADLTLLGITQRFRWLEPGQFLMGSPADELEREWAGISGWEGSETQHQVTLSQGFWLADTTVTQAFWQAVMGNNPSNFKDDPNNPVEQVSWQDAQEFISKLNSYFPGLQSQLPSEAQWEYACRAGTTTPFSFGENITPEQVNYNGNYPYADGKKGLYREKTIAVKSLPANPWGLYEMHGNVWEWCQDVWRQEISAGPVIDPLYTDDDEAAPRVIRGGSWYYYGWLMRSAIRFRNTPVNRGNNLGFRLALGHPARPGGAVQSGVALGSDADSRVAEQRQAVPWTDADKAQGWLHKPSRKSYNQSTTSVLTVLSPSGL